MSTITPRTTQRHSLWFWLCLGVLPSVALIIWLATAVHKVRDAAARMTNSGKFCQLGVAMHNYADAEGHLPGANAPAEEPLAKGTKYPVSWRVLLLPYIEGQDIFKQYHFDEPWDGPNNIQLIAKMPRSYRHPKADAVDDPVGYTHYRVFASRAGAKPSALFTDGMPGPKLNEIPDTLANTLMIVDAEEAVPWTMPEILLYDRNQPVPKLGGMFRGQFQAVRADGSSSRSFRTDMPEAQLRAWITKDGGEPLPEGE